MGVHGYTSFSDSFVSKKSCVAYSISIRSPGKTGATASLHDLKLVDLFDAATLLGYEAEGLCLGMQVENPSPAVVTVGLTPKAAAALPLLVETVAGELARLGSPLVPRAGAAG